MGVVTLINLSRWCWTNTIIHSTRSLFFPCRWATRSRWIFSSFTTETTIRKSKERRSVALESGKHSIVIKLNLILKSITEIANVLDMSKHAFLESPRVELLIRGIHEVFFCFCTNTVLIIWLSFPLISLGICTGTGNPHGSRVRVLWGYGYGLEFWDPRANPYPCDTRALQYVTITYTT